jgi:hypothetical protein
MAAVLRRPGRLFALVGLLLRTPRESVVLSGSLGGQALAGYLNNRRLGIPRNRLWRGVLFLPDDHADYLHGRSRRALRNNLQRAKAAGVTCEVVKGDSRGDELAAVLRRHYADASETDLDTAFNEFRPRITGIEKTVMAARDRDGETVAILAVTIDEEGCIIHLALAACHQARWALHDYLVQTLILRGVRYLLAGDDGPFGALAYSPNIQHYQRLLGYELRHVTPHWLVGVFLSEPGEAGDHVYPGTMPEHAVRLA